jgi:hypothetical protein
MAVVVELRPKGTSENIPARQRCTPPAGAIDTALRTLVRRCRAWEALPLARRIELLDAVIAGTAAVAPAWVARGWRGRERLLAALRRILHAVPNRFAFHAGAQDRFARFMRAHPEIELLGAGHSGSLPWGLITNLDPYSENLAFTTDPFAPILSETSLQSSSIADLVDGAVAFCNERLSGTLVATLIADPRSSRDPSTAAALERGIERLDYRMVTINLPPFVGLVYGHNGREAGRHGKTVIRAAFRSLTTPPWLVTHSHSHDVFRRLARFEAAPTGAQLPAIVWHTIRG